MKTLALLLILLASFPLAAKPRIGVVDIEQVFEQYGRKTQIESELQERVEALKKAPRVTAVQETDAQLKELAAIVRDQQARPSDREKASKDFDSLALEYQSLVQEMESFLKIEKRKAAEEMVKAIEVLIADIRAAVNEIGKKRNVDLVLESKGKTSTQTPTVIYLRDEIDLTEEVIAELNKGSASEE